MQSASQIPFDDEPQSGGGAALDAVSLAASGDPRAAIRALLVDLGEARALAAQCASVGYLRRRQPPRRLS